MKIGTTLIITGKDPIQNKILEYRSKIIEKDEKYLFIDHPINMQTNKTSYFPIGTNFTVSFIGKDENLYRFQTTVEKRIKLTIPSLAITFPNKDSIEKIQRREFVRVKATVDIAIHCPDHSFPPFTTVTVDISGGGLSFVTPNEITLEKNKEIFVWIILPMGSRENKFAKIRAKIVRTKRSKSNILTTSIKFTSISNNDEQNIVKFCFEKQREERINTLL